MNDYFYLTGYYGMKLIRIDLFRRMEWEFVIEYDERGNNRFFDVLTDGTCIFLIDDCAGIRVFDPRNNKLSPTTYSNTDALLQDEFQMMENAFSAVWMQNKVYVMGGTASGRLPGTTEGIYPTHNTHVFDVLTKSWSRAPPLPQSICFSSAVAVDNRWIVVHGGMPKHDHTKSHT